MRHREPAICLRAIDYSETSQVVCFLTRGEGLVRLLAKGSKRPKSKTGGALDLLSEGDLVYTTSGSGGLGTLIEFSEAESRRTVRGRPDRLYAAMYMVELVSSMLAEDDPHPEVWELLHNALARLGDPDSPVLAILAWYQWRFLRHVGLLGGLERCVVCGREVSLAGGEGLWFSSRLGGMVCAACQPEAPERLTVSRAVRAGLRTLLDVSRRGAGRRSSLPDDQAREVCRLLDYHCREQLGRPLRSSRYAIG
jgi:DNA repair protein RecO (recombination protein O)